LYRSNAQGANQSKLPIEIVARMDERHHKSVRNPGPTLIGRASVSSTNVGAGCSCHSTGADIIDRATFLPILSSPPVARLPGSAVSLTPPRFRCEM
jgi:hypothetical protein